MWRKQYHVDKCFGFLAEKKQERVLFLDVFAFSEEQYPNNVVLP